MFSIAKLRYVLGHDEQRKFLMVVCLMGIGAAIEMVAIGAIPSYVALLAGSAVPYGWNWLASVSWVVPGNSSVFSVLGGAGALFTLFVIKNSYLAFLASVQAKFVFGCQARLAQRLIDVHLQSSWLLLLRLNSANILNHATFQAMDVAEYVLRPVMTLLLEVLVVAAILFLLLFSEPIISVVALLVLGVTTLIFLGFVRRRLTRYASALQSFRTDMIRAVQDCVGGAKIAKVLGREPYLSRAFAVSADGYSNAARVHQVITEFPRLFVECAAMLGMVALKALPPGNARSQGFVCHHIPGGRPTDSALREIGP